MTSFPTFRAGEQTCNRGNVISDRSSLNFHRFLAKFSPKNEAYIMTGASVSLPNPK